MGKGTGDLYIKAECNLLTKTCDICDAYKYIASGSQSFNTSFDITNLFNISSVSGDYEISIKLKSTATKGFGMALNVDSGTQNKNLFRIGYNGSNNANLYRMANGGSGESYENTSKQYTANTDTILKMTRENMVYTGYIDDYTHAFSNYPAPAVYIQIESWSTSKTLTYTDFIVKPL